MTHVPPVRFRTAVLLLIPLALAACSQAPSTPPVSAANGTQADMADFVYDGTDHSWEATDDGLGDLGALALTSGENKLSTLGWSKATNGYGPAERNRSNGGPSSGGGTITLNGKEYASGLGVHASSSLTFALDGKCSTFASDIGMDDEVGSRGRVVFQVYADGTKIYDSGTMTGSSSTKSVSVSVAGKKELRLVVTDGGNGLEYDHADWANARVLGCTATSTGTPAPGPAPTPVPGSGGNVSYKGPLVITKGGTYTGNYRSTDPKVPAISIKTSEPVIIENANVKGPGNLISGFRMQLTVRNTRGYGVNPNISGRPTGRFINSEDTLNLSITNNYLEGTGGIYVRNFIGKGSSGQTIKILRNSAKNIDGRLSNGSGGYQNAFRRYQFVQFNVVRNLVNAEIAWNQVINEPGKSALEENINMYQSSGTSGSRVKIHDNLIWGAYHPSPATTSGYAGGGILLGDGNGRSKSTVGGYFDVYGNTIISTSNQGIGISGGHNHKVYNNRIVSSGLLPDGRKIASQNVGIYVWDMYGSKAGGNWHNNTVFDNKIAWLKYRSNGSTFLNNTWFADCSSTCYNNTTLTRAVTPATEAAEYASWVSRARAEGQKIGVN
ncbi:NPCBM/NEW2 domain-containing protein [Deinococcus rufus]|uniref:NPCBM/NEW2 domain-containing protein n=1 Tax=Deinococcus rufus TaxID=2136097 RepID=A0ABV7ZE13_9DEIO